LRSQPACLQETGIEVPIPPAFRHANLKRLAEAIEERDNIRAVILGVGINNDGNDKVGYTAPSSRGQAGAIRAAHRSAGIDAESIGYVEAHGTGTILGDPIEISALTEVFRETTSRRGFCGIGSAKSNFGHLSCAAGVAGLIKTVLALEHQSIPPTVHYTSPNPAIDLASSPFYVTTRLTGWERNGTARRAGVSSFGVGGTNAHVVLEEAPPPAARTEMRPHQVLILSARSEAALNEATKRLGSYLGAHTDIHLADAAFTLQLGRRSFKYRRAVVLASGDRERIVDALEQAESLAAFTAAHNRPAVFLFPGQGSQYPGMAAGLYQTEPVVRRAIDRCARLLKPHLGADLRKLLFPSRRNRGLAAEELRNTRWAQPALFVVGYALAELWKSWGVAPAAMIGHSVGEYVAAALAGVMTLEDAIAVIARRGQLISGLPRGSMLAVRGSPERLQGFVDADISIAAVNAPGFVVLSGPDGAIERLEKELAREQMPARRLHTSHAFHSSMMEPILAQFEEAVSQIHLSPPGKRFVSTLTGQWAGDEVTSPDYWSRQLRHAVRFADGMRTLMAPGSPAGSESVYLETGPGNTLSTFAREVVKEKGSASLCLPSLPGPDARRSDTEEALVALGRMWASGVEVDWEAFHRTERRSRVRLPTYPFEQKSYWIGTNPSANGQGAETRDPFNWFYQPVWREQKVTAGAAASIAGWRILLLGSETSPAASIACKLRELGCDVVRARPGAAFMRASEHEYIINPAAEEGIRELAEAVCSGGLRLAGVVECLSAAVVPEPGPTDLDTAADLCLLAPMRLAYALSRQTTKRPLPFLMVAARTTRVLDGDAIDPARALGAGIARVLPQEHPGLRVAHIDVDGGEAVADMIIAELAAGAPEAAVAIRGALRFQQSFEPVPIRMAKAPLRLPSGPVVMITGGLGHMGLNLAEALFARTRAKLVLLGRTILPDPQDWEARSQAADTPPAEKDLLQRLARMRSQRDDVGVLAADLNDGVQVKAAVDAAFERFGRIEMVVHGAARIDAGAFGSIAETDSKIVEAQFSPKLRGLWHLMNALRGREPQRWILHSSISTVLGGLALGAYAAANAVLDALALERGPDWLSIDWDAWDNAAEAQSASLPSAIQPREGSEVLLRLLGSWDGSRALVAINLTERLKAWVHHAEPARPEKNATDRHPRPSLTTSFVEPRTDTERRLGEIWASQLGLESVGIYDRFFDLGGHSLLAAQIASEICDRFEIELPVLELFRAPTVAELAVLVEKANSRKSGVRSPDEGPAPAPPVVQPELEGNAPEIAAKASYREFYNDVTRRLEQSGVGAASFFLNYGYVSVGDADEARFEVPPQVFNRNSVRLAFELIGSTQLDGRRVLDVGCGRGGTVALLAETFRASASGVDLSPEAIAFCRKTHGHMARFEVGDAEYLPFENAGFDVVTNMESSHTYPNLRVFFTEVARVLRADGAFLYTDLLPVERWAEVRALLPPLGFRIQSERDITLNVLASCDEVAANRAKAFGGSSEMIDNFLAVPGSAVYEQMRSGAWEYRILRALRV
jgi:acyl transferase domain-containing protein/ubiquinone/menaquinone biosynthesis C-methylase UbiE